MSSSILAVRPAHLGPPTDGPENHIMLKVGDMNTFASKAQFSNSLGSNCYGLLQEYSLVIPESTMHARDEQHHVSR